jgi:hypothetical protein
LIAAGFLTAAGYLILRILLRTSRPRRSQ